MSESNFSSQAEPFASAAAGPNSYPVAVVVRRRESTSRWQRYAWTVHSVVIDSGYGQHSGTQLEAPDSGGDVNFDFVDFLWSGFTVTLYKDQAESYYHNIMAPQPQLYVITRYNEQGIMEPFWVSASFDEAQAYEESDEQAHTVIMPEALYPWVERFVLTHYAPEPRKKRKRENWRDTAQNQPAPSGPTVK